MSDVILILPDGQEIDYHEHDLMGYLISLNLNGFVEGKRKAEYGFHALFSNGNQIAVSCDYGKGERFALTSFGILTDLGKWAVDEFISREVLERWFRIRSFD